MRRILLSLLLVGACESGAEVRAAQDCPTSENEIEVDRPDVTTSSIVVPVNSLQLEDGINLTRRSSSTILDGTNSRLRLGVAECLEVLLDVPDFNYTVHGTESSGFSDICSSNSSATIRPALRRASLSIWAERFVSRAFSNSISTPGSAWTTAPPRGFSGSAIPESLITPT
jgi:hypothetical protein